MSKLNIYFRLLDGFLCITQQCNFYSNNDASRDDSGTRLAEAAAAAITAALSAAGARAVTLFRGWYIRESNLVQKCDFICCINCSIIYRKQL